METYPAVPESVLPTSAGSANLTSLADLQEVDLAGKLLRDRAADSAAAVHGEKAFKPAWLKSRFITA